MVFDRRPDEVLVDVVQNGVTVFKGLVESTTTVIRTADSALTEMDDALTGGRPKFGETPQETFGNIFQMLEATLVEAQEKGSAAAPSVTQHAREILTRINTVEPAWRPGPTTITNVNDMFRAALRDLRASSSLIRLAQGKGGVTDLEGLTKWAEDLELRLQRVKVVKVSKAKEAAPTAAGELPEPQQAALPAPADAAPAPKPKRAKRDTTPKNKPAPDDVRFAQAVADEIGTDKVKGWALDFANGKISEQQWQTRLTNHMAAERDSMDDIFERALQRIERENNANQSGAN